MIVYRGCYAHCAAALGNDSTPSLSNCGTISYSMYYLIFTNIIYRLQHMLGAQNEANSYHHTRFGVMPTPDFTITAPVEPEPVLFLRSRTRTEW
jgi:hypothetical protein